MSVEDETEAYEIQNIRRKPLVLRNEDGTQEPPLSPRGNAHRSFYGNYSSPLMTIGDTNNTNGDASDEANSSGDDSSENNNTNGDMDLSSPLKIPTRPPNKNSSAVSHLKQKWEGVGSPPKSSPPSVSSPPSSPVTIGGQLHLSSPVRPLSTIVCTAPLPIKVPPEPITIQEVRMTKSAGATNQLSQMKSKSERTKKISKPLSISSDGIMIKPDNKIAKEHAKLMKQVKMGTEIREKEKAKAEKELMKEEKAREKEERERKEKEEKAREKEERDRKDREKKERQMKKKEEREKARLEKDRADLEKIQSPLLTPRKRAVFGRKKSLRSDEKGKGSPLLDMQDTDGQTVKGKYVLPDDEVEQQLNLLNNSSDVIALQALPLHETTSTDKQAIEGPNGSDDPEFILWPPESGLGKYRVYGQTVSTYPRILDIPGARQGDPVCDCFSVRCYDNGLIFCVCDGCGWGNSSCTAAKVVRATFMKRMHESVTGAEKKSIFDFANLLLEVLAQSHNDILEGKELWECGSTTVVAGLLLDMELDGEKIDEKGLLMISIGDCKVYKWDCKTDVISDLTYGSRLNLLNPSDCGGRVGPSAGADAEPIPDLRNLKLSFSLCNKGDLLWVVSDGVHDNIDPQWMGLLPKDMGIPKLANVQSWGDEILNNDQELLANVKNDFSMNLLRILLLRRRQQQREKKEENSEKEREKEEESDEEDTDEEEITSALDLLNRYFAKDSGDDYSLFALSSKRVSTRKQPQSPSTPKIAASPSMIKRNEGKEGDKGGGSGETKLDPCLLKFMGESFIVGTRKPTAEEEGDEDVSPRTITQALIKHAIRVTSAGRTFMEQNPNKRQPDDLLNYPGKMDHTTCVTFRV